MHNGFIGSNLAFLLGHLVGHFYGHTGLDLAQIWSNGQYVGPFVVAIIVGQHGTTSIEWMDQELGGLQGLLVHQTILLELLLDLHPLGANWHAGVILDLGDELLQILVHGSTKANWSGYLTKGDTFSTMKFAMASHCGMPCMLYTCEHLESIGCFGSTNATWSNIQLDQLKLHVSIWKHQVL